MNKMTVCKTCGKEVAKSAKSCPHCGAKSRSKKTIFITASIIILLIIIGLASLGGNSNATSGSVKSTSQDNSSSKSDTKSEKTNSNENQKTTTELFGYLRKNVDEIQKDLGKPNKIDGAQSSTLYDYGNFYIVIDKKIVTSIGIKGPDKTANGIKIGTSVKDVKSKLGNPTKESNGSNYIMEYRLDNNSTSIQYVCNDFHNPVNSIIITDLTAGKEKPMEVTKEKVESLIEGNWVLEKYMNEPNLSLFVVKFSNGVKDQGNGALTTKYSIINNNTIVYHVWNTMNQENHDLQYFIEFYENGERMEIYTVDKYGDRNPDDTNIYYRYN